MHENVASFRSEQGVVIILGCRVRQGQPSAALERRLERAWSFCRENTAISVVLFSGLGRDQPWIEAEVMKNWWQSRQQAEQRATKLKLLVEKKSRNTLQNAQRTQETLNNYGLTGHNWHYFLVTCEQHMGRAFRIFRRIGLDVERIPSPSPCNQWQRLRTSFKEFFSEALSYLRY